MRRFLKGKKKLYTVTYLNTKADNERFSLKRVKSLFGENFLIKMIKPN